MFSGEHQSVVIEKGAIVAPTTSIGVFTKVCSDATLGDGAVLDGLIIIPSNVRIEAKARIGCGVNFLMPVTKEIPTVVGRGAVIGANAIIHSGVTIGAGALVAPGTQIVRSIPAMARVEGAPARIVGYVGVDLDVSDEIGEMSDKIRQTSVRGVSLHKMPRILDIRGNLTVGEFGRSIPFDVKRYFIVFDVPSLETRGEHAHRECHQFLLCVRGSCALVADDGDFRQEFLLDSPNTGIYLPPMTWGIQYKYSHDAVLLVFASEFYDAEDYIRDYEEFVRLVKQRSAGENTGR